MANQLMAPPPTRARARPVAAPSSSWVQLQMKVRGVTTADLDFTVVAPETRPTPPTGSSRPGERDRRDDHILTIDLDDPFFQRVDVDVSTPPTSRRSTSDVLVTPVRGGRVVTARVGAAVFTPADRDPGTSRFRDLDDFTYRYRVATSSAIRAWRPSDRTIRPMDSVMIRASITHRGCGPPRVLSSPGGRLEWSRGWRPGSPTTPRQRVHAERTYLVDQASPRQEGSSSHGPALTAPTGSSTAAPPGPERDRGCGALVGRAHSLRGRSVRRPAPIVLQPLVDGPNVVRWTLSVRTRTRSSLDVRKKLELLGPTSGRDGDHPDHRPDFAIHLSGHPDQGQRVGGEPGAGPTDRLSIASPRRIYSSRGPDPGEDETTHPGHQVDLRSDPLEGYRSAPRATCSNRVEPPG